MRSPEARPFYRAKIAGVLSAAVLGSGLVFTGCIRKTPTPTPIPNLTESSQSSVEKIGTIRGYRDLEVYKMTDKVNGQVCYITSTFKGGSGRVFDAASIDIDCPPTAK